MIESILFTFLIFIVILAVLWLIIYLIESWIAPIPKPAKVALALVILILAILYFVRKFGI